MPSKKIKFGDICLVRFNPSVGDEFKKIRPALVIQSEKVSANSPYITVMPISSQMERIGPDDVLLIADKENRLLKDSVIRTHHISSFDRKRFMKVIGRANSTRLRKVRGYLRKHFNL
jgi:mRNA interferase MazF